MYFRIFFLSFFATASVPVFRFLFISAHVCFESSCMLSLDVFVFKTRQRILGIHFKFSQTKWIKILSRDLIQYRRFAWTIFQQCVQYGTGICPEPDFRSWSRTTAFTSAIGGPRTSGPLTGTNTAMSQMRVCTATSQILDYRLLCAKRGKMKGILLFYVRKSSWHVWVSYISTHLFIHIRFQIVLCILGSLPLPCYL